MNGFPVISLITFTPLLAGLVVLAIGNRRAEWARRVALGSCLLTLGLVAAIMGWFDTTGQALQFVERHTWVPGLAVDYYVGLDGLGLIMVALTALLVPMSLLVLWRQQGQSALLFALVLFLQTGLMGTFTALSFFHWFIFWELSLVPAFFLIRLWGGPERAPAATQFFVYTMVGSIAMLVAFAAVFLGTGSFDFIALAELARTEGLAGHFQDRLGWSSLSGETLSLLIFGGVFLGVAVKVPLVPLHTWLPAAYSEAPTGVTMLLTGLMSKMGVYGFLRILAPIFPEELRAMLTPLLWLAVITIVFSAASAFAQRDLKRMFAYSSINHLGYCLLGLFAAMQLREGDASLALEKASALNGVFLQMFNHGITAATLFCFIDFIERRTDGRRGLDDFGGLRKVAPVFCGLMGIAAFASLGLPGLSSFVGEFLIFKGAFPLVPWAAALSVLGLLITAVFLLTFLQRVFNGPLNERWAGFTDLSMTERLILAPTLTLIFVLGVFPQWLIGFTNSTVVRLVDQLQR